jgi:C-terminal processing protease CtpA/Prc
MAAGIKVGDVIQEVNGKDCQSMAALELSDLMELKSLIQHIPDTDSPKVQRTTKPVKTKVAVHVLKMVSSSYNCFRILLLLMIQIQTHQTHQMMEKVERLQKGSGTVLKLKV